MIETLATLATLALLVVHTLRIRQVAANASRAAAELSSKIDYITSEQEIQHQIDRRFIGVNLIEGQVLPLLKQRQIDCGTFDSSATPSIDCGTFPVNT